MQILLGDLVAAADALGHVVAGELDVDPARVGAKLPVHLEEAGHLVEHVVEPPGLVPARRLERVAVHRVADPHELRSALGDRLDQRGKTVAHLLGAHPRDERQPARFTCGIEPVDQGQQVRRSRQGAKFDANRVVDAAGELDVRAVQRPGPLADPQEVRGHVVGQAGAGVDPGEGAFVFEQQRLVAGVELHRAELLRICAACAHERQRAVDLAREFLIPLPGRALPHEVLVPRVHLPQVGVASGGERAAQVQRRGRVVVGGQQPARVRPPRPRGEVQAVDRVAAVGGQHGAVARLGGGGPGLGELPRHAADLDDWHAGRVGEHDGDLQQRPKLGLDPIRGRAEERLRAVTALEHEGLPARHRGEPVLEQVALAREHQRRKPGQVLKRGTQLGRLRPLRLLRGRPAPPGVKGVESRGRGGYRWHSVHGSPG